MPDSEASIREAWERYSLLKNVHHLFSRCIPTLEDVKSGRYQVTSKDNPTALNDLTILRSDIKLLPIELQDIDIDQVAKDDNINRLINSLDSLLGLFEESVRDLRGPDAEVVMQQNAKCIHPFPKLFTLRSLTQRSASLPELQTSSSSLDKYIKFPPSKKTIAECRRLVEGFWSTIVDVFPCGIRRWNAKSQLQEVTEQEVNFINDAYEFGKTCSNFFQLLVNCFNCEAQHVARLHLSGFHTGQLEMLLGTGEYDWVPARFIRSSTADSADQTFRNMCTHIATPGYRNQMILGRFNENTIWEDRDVELAPYDLSTSRTSSNTLNQFLRDFATREQCETTKKRKLDRMSRKIVGVLLACSLFKLFGSPWLQYGFEGQNIHLLPNESSNRSLQYWRPHISCNLSSHSDQRCLPEDVAALGVLILELETDSPAGWIDDDLDLETETKSNRTRLCRILGEWKGDLTDIYHEVGLTCSHFDYLVENFECLTEGFHHIKIDQDQRSLAILYKCIVNPLYKQLVSDFGAAERLFEGISSLSVPVRQRRVSTIGPLVLYDDAESTKPDNKSRYAEEFIETLDDGFLQNIKTLRSNLPQPGLAERSNGARTPNRIRIAVLDTGIDTTDNMVGSAMRSRIKGKRSWVGSIDSYEDTYGHGTHVTRLLLRMAPAAEIYVAKITDDNTVHPDHMNRIADAIDWAVNEWKVNIISMSFGYQRRNLAISDAITRAFRADTLMFAAASNEGGNIVRLPRPARSDSVICIYACDGNGNKGGMSPSPKDRNANYTTLGVAVKSRWKGQTVYKSGTSFATPVAAAFAADILEFANLRCQFAEEHKKLLYKKDGMLAVFHDMCQPRDGYDYLQPRHLWDGKDEYEVARVIRGILEELE